MIDSIRFRNFKALRDVELELDRLTVLVGPNASGKTSVLAGLHLLTRLAFTDPRDVFEGAASVGEITSRGAEGDLELAFSGTFDGRPGALSVRLPWMEDPELPLGLAVREAAWLRFDLDRLAEPSYSDLPTPVIGADGSGLAAVLADTAVSRPDDFARLQEALRAVIPGLLRVRLVRAQISIDPAAYGDDHVWGHEIVFDMAGASDVPARAASEGMLRALGLFAVLLGPDQPELVLIDHLEQGLNPRGAGELVSQLNQILELDPRLQIVAVTDSPAVVDGVAAESVRVHCLLEDGSVRIKPLVLHPQYRLRRDDLRAGAFWMEVGDAWVAEATRPPPLPPPPLPGLRRV
jgi:predicted ATPase